MRCNFYTERYWVSFKEFLCYIKDDVITPYAYSEMEFFRNDFLNFLKYHVKDGFDYMQLYSNSTAGLQFYPNLFKHDEVPSHSWEMNPYVNDIWHEIKTRFAREYVFDISFDKVIYDSNPSTQWSNEEKQEWDDATYEWIIKLLTIMSQTYERYATLLDFYAAKKSQLLDKVESLTRFNDTPQDTGEFSDDEHTTHITSTKNDYDTLMARLDEVDRKYRNLLKDWSNEFECLFIHEESL